MSASTSAYGQARARLPEPTLEARHLQLAQPLEANVPAERFGCGRRVRVVDGTPGSMPDTAPQSAGLPPTRVARKPAAASRC
jgi:hypothetical protein